MIIDKAKGIYCKHIEKYLPRMPRSKVVLAFKSTMDIYADIRNKDVTEEEIIKKLTEFGLSEFEIELLLARVLEGKTMQEIVREQGWTSLSSANYFFRKALKNLRKGGFSTR